MLNAAIELHDSVVESFVHSEGAIQIALCAYIHKSEGKPGVDAGSGFVQNVTIEFGTVQIDGDIGDLPADIYSGSFYAAGQTFPA